ncbi:Eco57I restriction-modification methylase domain-containing protein [Bradyrhizobium guangdongense]
MISGNLFTRDYLLDGIDRTAQWIGLTDKSVEAFRKQLKSIAGKFLKIAKPNEAETEKDFIYPVIETLGWSDYQVQQILSQKGRKQVPDALLFADDAAKSLAVAEAQQWKRFQHGLAVLEAKRWNRALDRADKRDPSEEGVPSTQMLQYLSRVDVQTNNKVRLGILTNGSVWRLYFQGALSVSEDYLEIDLAQALELPGHQLNLLDHADERLTSDRVLRLFILFFGKAAFMPVEGPRTFHDLSREAGKTWEEQVTKDLSRLVFGELFPKLVTALAKHDPARPADVTDAYLDDIRQAALILLYRLLFVVYAEDRDLLPDQREPYKSYSLTTMRLDIAERMDRKQVFSSSAATYWPKLRAVFKAIAEGDDDLGIPPYNGGLFAADSARLLTRVELPDSIVSALIFGLSHREEEGRARYINYRDLSVQQLGTIYERTLEYGLKYEDGAVTVSADDAARHESGSYYTPDSLVSLIIEKAVGPFIEERLAAFRERSAALAQDKRRPEIRLAELQGLDPASHILELRICDPAMGSGHFLVSLVDWLADHALAAIAEAEAVVDWSEAPYRSPVLNNIEATRQDIIKQATQHGWPFTIEHLDDRHIVRRTILKRCIYGVDRNPMAVELAKVALWLHTFTVGAPLSFLDHHLRCGNSLLGFWLRSAMDRLTAWGGQLLINEPMKKAMAQAVAMQRLERVTDADIAEVHESKTLFDGIEQETQPLNTFIKILYALDWQKLDKDDQAAIRAWLDGQFGDPIDIARGKLRLGEHDAGAGLPDAKDVMQRLPDKIAPSAERFAAILVRARDLVQKERFQHWQVAFPGVWKRWESAERVGGFDAVIGNPPYVRQELIKEYKPALKRAYSETYDGSADLYVYFYEQGLNLLRSGGRLSYVVTNKWMRVGYADRLRDLFSKNAWIEFVADFGHAKKFFPDADVFPSIAVIRKPNSANPPDKTDVCVIPRDDVPEKGLDEAVAKATYALPRTYFGKDPWALEPPAVAALLTKIKAAGSPLKSVVPRLPVNGIKTGLNEAFLIDADEHARLVASDPGCASIIKPYLRGQDIRRWHSPDRPQFMILLKSSSDHAWPWSGKSEAEAETIFQKTYPALYERMKRFEDYVDPKTGNKRGLRHREDQGKFWWELRPCAYYDIFAQPKIIYQAIQFYARYTFEAEDLYGNNKTYFLGSDNLALLGILNSPLLWWYGWRHFIHMKDEALSNDQVKIAELPIPPELLKDKQLKKTVSDLLSETRRIAEAESAMREWLHQEFEVKRGVAALRKPSALSFDEFVAAVKSGLARGRKLTAAEIAELKREYRATIEPVRSSRGMVARLEISVSNAVNAGYGLSQEDIALMWSSAPPRMPFSPQGLAADEAGSGSEDEGE